MLQCERGWPSERNFLIVYNIKVDFDMFLHHLYDSFTLPDCTVSFAGLIRLGLVHFCHFCGPGLCGRCWWESSWTFWWSARCFTLQPIKSRKRYSPCTSWEIWASHWCEEISRHSRLPWHSIDTDEIVVWLFPEELVHAHIDWAKAITSCSRDCDTIRFLAQFQRVASQPPGLPAGGCRCGQSSTGHTSLTSRGRGQRKTSHSALCAKHARYAGIGVWKNVQEIQKMGTNGGELFGAYLHQQIPTSQLAQTRLHRSKQCYLGCGDEWCGRGSGKLVWHAPQDCNIGASFLE